MRLPPTFIAAILTILFSIAALGQNTRIVIPAGTPEDKDLTAISAETDTAKQAAAYEGFIQKYSSNKAAVAYAEWQLSQQYLTAGDNAKALSWGEKALKDFPDDLDIIVADTNVAMAMKNNAKTVDFAVQGAAVYHSILQQPKPANVSDTDWNNNITQQQLSAKPDYEFLENAAYNAIVAEQDANQRMTFIEKYTPAFPKSPFDAQVAQIAMVSLQQVNQPQRLQAYGEKALASNPESIPTLLMLAGSYAGDPKTAGKAAEYAEKVLKLTGADPGDQTLKSYAGIAHTALGRANLNRDRAANAATELKIAVAQLQSDPPDQQVALYYLGYASAKQNRKAESVAALEKAAAINGPYQAPAKEMLAKIQAAGKK
jgi:tetratricopeptide (TPR) repeat protein